MCRVCLLLMLALLLARAAAGQADDARPAAGIQDNSFFVEEAYNQEPGVVQHILNISASIDRMHGPDDRELEFVFTQEWPLFSQTHQLSYTVPFSFLESGGDSARGFGDVLLNYRLQALMENDTTPAFAPRLSLILPSGDENRGLGSGNVGLQTNLPFSKILSDRWTLHANAGATWFPDDDLVSYNIGGSAIYAVTRTCNLMLEAIGSWDEDVNDRGRKERSFSAVISPGVRYAFNHQNDAQTVIGIAAPIGLTSAAPDFGVFFYFSFEHPFVSRTAGN